VSSSSKTAIATPSTSPDFKPTFAKVPVRYNPESDEAMNRRQAARTGGLRAQEKPAFHVRIAGADDTRAAAQRDGRDRVGCRREVLRPAPSTQPNHHVLCQAAKRCCHYESVPDRARAGAVNPRLIPPHYNMNLASRSIGASAKPTPLILAQTLVLPSRQACPRVASAALERSYQ
jgi:hypothetical protein